MKIPIDDSKWKDILFKIKEKITEVSYRTWFLPLKPLEIDTDAKVIYFGCANDFIIEVHKNRYISIFEETVEEVFKERYKVLIKLADGDSEKSKSPEGSSSSDISESNDEFKGEFFLNPKYSFDNFVVGSNNNYAHAVALAVAEAPAKTYNPLFIYGKSGLGKTHLMHAIGHYILKNDPNKKVLYVSSEMFASELIKAIQDNKNNKFSSSNMRSFKEKYRKVDILLIDDIQFIEGKEATQIEFFHTFNTLYDFNKQIVISSDRHPSQLKDLDERLRSRFQWNIIADIQPPDFETRVAIMRKKAELEKIEIDEDMINVINMIAEKVKFNVRDLESALTRLLSYSKLFKQKITVKFARNSLNDIFSTGDFNISCETIKKTVCKKYGIKISEIESSNRKRVLSHPRQIAMYLCRELTDISLPKIGDCFGGRDHTTVLHAHEKISSEMKTKSIVADEVNELINELQ